LPAHLFVQSLLQASLWGSTRRQGAPRKTVTASLNLTQSLDQRLASCSSLTLFDHARHNDSNSSDDDDDDGEIVCCCVRRSTGDVTREAAAGATAAMPMTDDDHCCRERRERRGCEPMQAASAETLRRKRRAT
jgi:hypothetical protein